MAAIIAVFELPPKFSRNSHVKTESRYGMKSAFFDFLFFDAYGCTCTYEIKEILVLFLIFWHRKYKRKMSRDFPLMHYIYAYAIKIIPFFFKKKYLQTILFNILNRK